jgi:hypothetical protein
VPAVLGFERSAFRTRIVAKVNLSRAGESGIWLSK